MVLIDLTLNLDVAGWASSCSFYPYFRQNPHPLLSPPPPSAPHLVWGVLRPLHDTEGWGFAGCKHLHAIIVQVAEICIPDLEKNLE